MIIILVYIVLCIPVLVEPGEDLLLIRLGWNEKLISNIIRTLLIISAGLYVDFKLNYAPFYLASIVSFLIFSNFFNYLINWALKKPWDYLSNKGIDKLLQKIPFVIRAYFGLWLLMTFIIILQYNRY